MKIYQKFGKRCVDLVISGGLLFAASPLLILISFFVRLDSPGPVLFKQVRCGKGGATFEVCKFRSMVVGNNVYDSSKGDRITRVGHWLRKTSLDELPQLLNVLKGDMSLIGPRPWLPEYFELMNNKQRKRYSVKPGITGLAQATGRNALTIDEKIACDITYTENVSFLNDLRIVFMTMRTLFDESTIDIGKSGIQAELQYLRTQNQ